MAASVDDETDWALVRWRSVILSGKKEPYVRDDFTDSLVSIRQDCTTAVCHHCAVFAIALKVVRVVILAEPDVFRSRYVKRQIQVAGRELGRRSEVFCDLVWAASGRRGAYTGIFW